MDSLSAAVTLQNGVFMPRFGFGVYKLGQGKACVGAIKEALRLGYRLIDTASVYGNEQEVGQAIKETDIPREEIFITTKIWNNERAEADQVRRAFDASLERLGLDYVDHYMIHWPVLYKGASLDAATWKVLEALYTEGRVRSLGVCNFQVVHLQALAEAASVPPMVNQIELNPFCTNEEVFFYCREAGIPVQAYSPLARAGELFVCPEISALAKKYGKTPAQVVLRWHWQLGSMPIPKSGNVERIKENTEFFDFALSREEMESLTALNRNHCTGGSKFVFDRNHSVILEG